MGLFHELKQTAKKHGYSLKRAKRGSIILSKDKDVRILKTTSEAEVVVSCLKSKR